MSVTLYLRTMPIILSRVKLGEEEEYDMMYDHFGGEDGGRKNKRCDKTPGPTFIPPAINITANAGNTSSTYKSQRSRTVRLKVKNLKKAKNLDFLTLMMMMMMQMRAEAGD